MRPRLFNPLRRFVIANRAEEPTKEREAIPSPEPETGSVRREGVRERVRVVVAGPEGVGNDLRDRFGVFLVIQQVGSDARRPCDRHPVENGPLIGADRPAVEPDVRPTRLPPFGQRELVPVRGKVAETIQRRGRTVGYDALLRCPLPGRNLRGELEPCRTKVEVIRRRRPRQAVHAVRHPVKHARLGEPLQGSLGDTGTFRLTARDEPPLIFSDLSDAAEGRVLYHYCIIVHI